MGRKFKYTSGRTHQQAWRKSGKGVARGLRPWVNSYDGTPIQEPGRPVLDDDWQTDLLVVADDTDDAEVAT